MPAETLGKCSTRLIGGKEPFEEAVITVINFGEKAAGSIATATKDRCADENVQVSPKVAKMIKEKCFRMM